MNEIQKKYLELMRAKCNELTEQFWKTIRDEPSKAKHLDLQEKHWERVRRELKKLNDKGMKEIELDRNKNSQQRPDNIA